MNSNDNDNNKDGDASRAFDFLLGERKIINRRLVKRLQGCDEWESFEAWQTNQTLPGRIGNVDDFVAGSWRPGYVGLSLRLFNPQTGLWSIFWLDNQTGGLNRSGLMLPPVVGGFENGIGIFEGSDVLDGRAIRVRYTWSDVDTDRPRWEQAMSGDDGKTWEMNWSMVFEKQLRPSQRP
jgi:hypothetical protein